MLKTPFAIILASALSACSLIQKPEPAPASSLRNLNPAAICGPTPYPVSTMEGARMSELDQLLLTHIRQTRLEDLDLFRRRYLEEPLALRDQIRICKGVVSSLIVP